MKFRSIKIDANTNIAALVGLQESHRKRLSPVIVMAFGIAAIVLATLVLFAGGYDQDHNKKALEQASFTLSQISGSVRGLRRVVTDPQVKELALLAVTDPDRLVNLRHYLGGSIDGVIEVSLFSAELDLLKAEDLGPYGYAVLDMLLSAREQTVSPIQVHGSGAESYTAMVVRFGREGVIEAYLLLKLSPDYMTSVFKAAAEDTSVLALAQISGGSRPLMLTKLDRPLNPQERISWLSVPYSLYSVAVVQHIGALEYGGLGVRVLLFILGSSLLGFGLVLKFDRYVPPGDAEKGGSEHESSPESGADPQQATAQLSGPASSDIPGGIDSGDGFGAIKIPDLGFNLEKVNMSRKKDLPPVELVESIFRAYDIRGIVGETLDAEVAFQVGQVVGSLTLEQDAGPVVVARDGRDSGPALVEGMIAGISSTGCDVIDIGAVPTGVLYFAAYELGKGTGVMVTGSHNPPEYNGIKMVIGGITLAGDKITGMYGRIKSGDLRVGKGKVSQQEMLERYRKRISGDIQLKRPLKVVADCGNGIGGVCAADVLRDIGAEVISLYDEVDGTFPNHHPDPSEPENLKDLIESVKMMDADLGVAFDGDADRLGVVTSTGEIIYSDRLMMLFVKDILSRVPGSTIIYDVKCTGHLHRVIEEAGGKGMMYKTGHSLIKNKMKEVDAPFAGEMSGHFFFKERWYGFDCGIYSAARLLEILAADDREPVDVLGSLPNSVSTPELKLHMQEGENHAFITELQAAAKFEGAKVNTIDGVRADFADGWGLVRASNTTPILVLRFDADNEAALERIKDVFKQQMLAINGQLKLPF